MVISKGVFEEVVTEIPAGAQRAQTFPGVSEALSKVKKAETLRELERVRLEIHQFIEEGDAKFEAGNYLKAEESYRIAYKASLNTSNKSLQSHCLCLVGSAIGMQGRDKEASSFFGEAMELEPGIAQIWYNIGVGLGKLEQYDEALFSFKMALELEPEDAWAWVGKGAALSSLGRYKEALSCFDRALELEPENVWAWRGKGVELLRLEHNEEALSSLEKALELEPDDAWTWAGKGAVLLELERYEDALSSFERALELKPDHALSWLGKGLALSKLERYEEARESSERVLSLREKLPDKGTALFALQAQLILIQGLESISSRDMEKAEERALELINLKKEAEKDDMAQVVEKAVAEFREGLSKKALKQFDEFEVILTVLSIEDPLERWKALGERISEKWPKGLSAVEAIRKERE